MDIISEAMRELGKRSAKARKEKYGNNYMREIQKKGVEARQRKAKQNRG